MLQYTILSRTERSIADTRVVASSTKDIDICTLRPIRADRSVDGRLNVGSVEVDRLVRKNVVSCVDAG